MGYTSDALVAAPAVRLVALARATIETAAVEDGYEVRRCDFSVLGTALASAGEYGVLRLRRAGLAGLWAVAAALETPESGGAPELAAARADAVRGAS